MASASNSKNLGSESGNVFTLSCSFSESSNDTLLADNKTRITASARLHSNGGSWSSNYTSHLRLYWYDNNKNSSRPEKASASTSALSGGANLDANATFDVIHKEDGTLSGYVYAKWTRGSSSGGYCPRDGDVGAPVDGNGNIYATSLITIAVKPSYNSISASEITSSSVRLKASIETHGKSITGGGWDITTDPNKASWSYEAGDVTDKTLTGLQANTTYYYRGYCVTSAGGTNSSWASFTTAKPAKPTITSFEVTERDEDLITVHATASASLQAAISTIEFGKGGDDLPPIIWNTATDGSYTFTNLSTDTLYYIWVRAKDNFNTYSDNSMLEARTTKHKVIKVITPDGVKRTPAHISQGSSVDKDLNDQDIVVVD